MNNLDSSLICIEIDSIALGYRALNIICDVAKDQLRVLDASPMGKRFLILALGKETILRDAMAKARSDIEATHSGSWIDADVFANVPQEILSSIFSLEQSQLGESLVVVECKTVVGCLASSISLITGHGLTSVEIKIHRSSAEGAYGFFTGKSQACLPAAEDARTRLKNAMREGTIEVIAAPSKTLRSYFQLSGEV